MLVHLCACFSCNSNSCSAGLQRCFSLRGKLEKSCGLNREHNAISKDPTQTERIVQEEHQFIIVSGLSCTEGGKPSSPTKPPWKIPLETELQWPTPLHTPTAFPPPRPASPSQGGAYHEPDGERHLAEDVGAVRGDRGDTGAPQDGEQPGLVHRVQVHTQVGHGVVPARGHTA